MSQFTQAQYEALTAAIAMGATRVKYQDKDVEYRSLADMREIRDMMARDLGIAAPVSGPRRVIGIQGKGL